jgi:polyhydroxyalkanoate synthesis repressor PhaR
VRLIKKYPNRKFYDMEDKRYVSLEGIASLVRAGEDVQVVENESGEDITTLVLSQILREQGKKGYALPQTLLTALIRRGTGGLEQLRSYLQASMKSMHTLEDELQDNIDALAERGEISLTEAQELREELLARARDRQASTEARILREIQASLIRLDVPTSSDVQSLHSQLEKIDQKLNSLLSDLQSGV